MKRIREKYLETIRYPYPYGLTTSEIFFKKNLAFLRGLAGLSKRQLLLHLDVDKTYYYKLESLEKHMSPSFEWLEVIADFYGIDVYLLLFPDLEETLSDESKDTIRENILRNMQ